jgi:integrase
MFYLNHFLDFAIYKQLLSVNYAKNIKNFKVETNNNKKNFTKDELQALLENDKLDKVYIDILKILLYGGMRIGEFYLLEKSDILEEDGIKYIDIKESKSEAGKREIPIHSEISNVIENFDFSYLTRRWKDGKSFRGNFLNQIYKIVKKHPTDKDLNKTTHTLRGNFADELINKNPDKIAIAQEIIGHEKNANIKLTINTYAKGFSLKNKKDVIDTINYFN